MQNQAGKLITQKPKHLTLDLASDRNAETNKRYNTNIKPLSTLLTQRQNLESV